MRDAGPNRISRQYYFGAMWMSIVDPALDFGSFDF
jgi:hypothetical protein